MKSIVIKILNAFSKRILAKYNPIIIGITGSVGKSSAAKAIYEILKNKYNVRCNKSNYRTEISIPLAVIGAESGRRSIFMWTRVVIRALGEILFKTTYPDILILEMGVDRPDDMKNMLKVVKPNIGILTYIGEFPSHAKYFKSIKNVAREKTMLLRSLGKKDLAILNCDDKFVMEAAEGVKAKKIVYGFCADNSCSQCDIKAEEIFLGEKKWKVEGGEMGMSFKISYKGTTVPFRLFYALGRSHIYSTLAAAAVGIHFGFNLVEMSEILSKYQPLGGRMKLIKGINGSLIIDDTFNANPHSMSCAIETLGRLEAPRKIAVLGDMLELGDYCRAGHKKIGKEIPKFADLLFTFGERSKIIFQQAIESGINKNLSFHFENIEELVELLKKSIKPGDVMLIKGSRAMRMERIVKRIMAEPEANKL